MIPPSIERPERPVLPSSQEFSGGPSAIIAEQVSITAAAALHNLQNAPEAPPSASKVLRSRMIEKLTLRQREARSPAELKAYDELRAAVLKARACRAPNAPLLEQELAEVTATYRGAFASLPQQQPQDDSILIPETLPSASNVSRIKLLTSSECKELSPEELKAYARLRAAERKAHSRGGPNALFMAQELTDYIDQVRAEMADEQQRCARREAKLAAREQQNKELLSERIRQAVQIAANQAMIQQAANQLLNYSNASSQ